MDINYRNLGAVFHVVIVITMLPNYSSCVKTFHADVCDNVEAIYECIHFTCNLMVGTTFHKTISVVDLCQKSSH